MIDRVRLAPPAARARVDGLPNARGFATSAQMCDSRTMGVDRGDRSPNFGARITQARDDADMTQAELARAVGLDRTAVAKLEGGTRKVSATELVVIAAALDRPIDWFVTESPPAVVSRRSDAAAGGRSRALDLKLERLARDSAFLLGQGVLTDPGRRSALDLPTDLGAAEALAAQARSLAGVASGPVLDLQRVVERVGLLAFCLDLGESGGDAGYVEVGNLGVALINGHVDPGRRRFNLAHELGHHLFGDAYAPEVLIGPDSGTERLINAFAVHFLLPRSEAVARWQARGQDDDRLTALALSATFRTSWSVTCNQLRNLGLIDDQTRTRYLTDRPTSADWIALGERWIAELDAPTVPPEYGKRVLHAYLAGKLSGSRTEELLWGTVVRAELPDQRPLPLESLRREFESLR